MILFIKLPELKPGDHFTIEHDGGSSSYSVPAHTARTARDLIRQINKTERLPKITVTLNGKIVWTYSWAHGVRIPKEN